MPAINRASVPLSAVGLAAAGTGLGGFAFGLFGQLGIAGLIAQQSVYALTILALVIALILATGRATLPLQSVRATWAIDGLIGFCAIVAAIGIFRIFMSPQETTVFVRLEPSLADVQDPPKLTTQVYLGHGQRQELADGGTQVMVSKDGELILSIRNLDHLLAQYHEQNVRVKSEAERFQNLHQVSAEQDDIP